MAVSVDTVSHKFLVRGNKDVVLYAYTNGILSDSLVKSFYVKKLDPNDYFYCTCTPTYCDFISNGNFAGHDANYSPPPFVDCSLPETSDCWNKIWTTPTSCDWIDNYCFNIQSHTWTSNEAPSYFNADNGKVPFNHLIDPSSTAGLSSHTPTDEAYAGIFTYETGGFLTDASVICDPSLNTGGFQDTRDYIMQQFKHPLKTGEKYKLTFWVSISSTSTYATRIGALLSYDPVCFNAQNHNGDYSWIDVNNSVLTTPHQVFEQTPNPWVTIPPPTPTEVVEYNPDLLNMDTWTKVEFEFIATNDMNYIYIGNFHDDVSDDYFVVQGGHHLYSPDCTNGPYRCISYYFVDDVSLVPVIPILTAYPNPVCAGDPVTITATDAGGATLTA
jgi:hypothetical protein